MGILSILGVSGGQACSTREVHVYAQTAQSPHVLIFGQSCQLHPAFSSASTVIKETLFAKSNNTIMAPKETKLHLTMGNRLHFGALGGILTGKKQLQDGPLPTPTVGIDIVEPIILLRFYSK